MTRTINNFKKSIVAIVCAVFLLGATSITASAASSSFTPHVITAGTKMYYYHNSSSGFYMSKNSTLGMGYVFAGSYSHESGYRNMDTSTDYMMYSNKTSNAIFATKVPASAYYKAYIKNTSSSSIISVLSGYITS